MGIDLFVSADTTSGGGPPTGAAGGHLGGSYPSPTVQILSTNAAVNCAGSANVTLNAGQYNNVTIDFTGILTGNISVILPLNAHQQWDLFNATSGAFTLTVIGATGTGVVMPQSQRAIVTTDGTNFVFATPPVTAAGVVSGASYTAPTGSGLPHIVGGAQQAASFVGAAYQSLQTNAGATDVVFGALRLDQAAAVAGLLPVANVAAGSNTQVLTTTGGVAVWAAPAGGAPTGAAGGNLSGTYPNPVVALINGAAIPAAGALVTGNAPYVSSVSSLTYSALNLAGGSGWVTGALPAANQAAQAMAGDVGGTTAASTITALAVSKLANGGSNAILMTNAGASSSVWAPAMSGDATMPSTGVITIANLAVSKLAAGAAGTVLTGPGPAFSTNPTVTTLGASGAITSGSLAGAPSTSLTFGANTLSVAGAANVTLTNAQAAFRTQIFTGVLTGNIIVSVPNTQTTTDGSEYEIYNTTTGAFTLSFQRLGDTKALWIPPGVPEKLVYSTAATSFVYAPGSFAGGDLTATVSLINTNPSDIDTALFQVPFGFHLYAVYVRTAISVAGGASVTLSIGTAAGGTQVLNGNTPGAAGAQALGITVSQLGSDMASGDGYTHEYLSATTFYIRDSTRVANCTAGSVVVTLRGAVVPLWEASGVRSFASAPVSLPRGHQRRRAGSSPGTTSLSPGICGQTLPARWRLPMRPSSRESTTSAATAGTLRKRP